MFNDKPIKSLLDPAKAYQTDRSVGTWIAQSVACLALTS